MASAPDIVVEVEASPDVDTASAAPVADFLAILEKAGSATPVADFLAILEKAGSATPIAGDELPLAS